MIIHITRRIFGNLARINQLAMLYLNRIIIEAMARLGFIVAFSCNKSYPMIYSLIFPVCNKCYITVNSVITAYGFTVQSPTGEVVFVRILGYVFREVDGIAFYNLLIVIRTNECLTVCIKLNGVLGLPTGIEIKVCIDFFSYIRFRALRIDKPSKEGVMRRVIACKRSGNRVSFTGVDGVDLIGVSVSVSMKSNGYGSLLYEFRIYNCISVNLLLIEFELFLEVLVFVPACELASFSRCYRRNRGSSCITTLHYFLRSNLICQRIILSCLETYGTVCAPLCIESNRSSNTVLGHYETILETRIRVPSQELMALGSKRILAYQIHRNSIFRTICYIYI